MPNQITFKFLLILTLVISLGFNQIELFYGLFVSNVAILAFIIYSAAINTVFFNPINVRMDCHPLLLIFILFKCLNTIDDTNEINSDESKQKNENLSLIKKYGS